MIWDFDEGGAREEIRKHPERIANVLSHLSSAHPGTFSEDDARNGNQKIEESCDRLEGIPVVL